MRDDPDRRIDQTTLVVKTMIDQGNLTHVKAIGEKEELHLDDHQSEYTVLLVAVQ